jgi:hypothetical protein
MGSGMNEHFSGVNAGTMFGDGIYLAEDMGKSDQYCRPLKAGAGAGLYPMLYPTPDTQHPAPSTLHPTPFIILPINTTKQNHGRLCKQRWAQARACIYSLPIYIAYIGPSPPPRLHF